MSDERRDDEILGRALARAIETMDVNETPFERSRLASPPASRGFGVWHLAGVVAAVVLALAFGTWFTRPNEAGPVSAPSTPVVQSGTPAQATAPAASATPTTVPSIQPQTVFVSRAGVPPQVTLAPGGNPQASIEARIKARIDALNNAVSGLSPTSLLADPTQFYVRSVKVEGDTATIDYSARWPAMGSGFDAALAAQIVYTATEETTVMKVLVTENGNPMNTGHIFWDRPLAREDVAGYSAKAETGISDPGTGDVPAAELRLSTTYSVDTFSRGLARFVIQFDRTTGAIPRGFTPKFDAKLYGPAASDQSGHRGKASVWVTVDGTDPNLTFTDVDRSPLRSINKVSTAPNSTIYQLKLDGAYPWRVFTLSNPSRLVIDIGGMVQSVSDRIAVYAPAPIEDASGVLAAPVGRQFTVSGAARTFEANVVWRVLDSSRKVVVEGHTLASLGSSPVWGTFSTQVNVPASVSGTATLEVFEASAQDGRPLGTVSIPLTVR